MALPDLKEVHVIETDPPQSAVTALLMRAKASGIVTPDEIDALFVAQDMSPEQLDALYVTLQQAGIEIVEEDEDEEPLLDVEPEVIIEAPVEDAPSPTADPVRMYLKTIGKVPLLTAEDEVMLAKKVEAGLEAEEQMARNIRPTNERLHDMLMKAALMRDVVRLEAAERPSPELIRELLHRVEREGQLARKRLIESNLRLVVSIAKRYVGRGMLFLDLIQEGNLGLIRAVEKFDYSKGYRLLEGLQVLDVRDVVDPPSHHARDRRPGAHDPHPGAHGRDDQQAHPRAAAADARSEPRAAPRRSRARDGPDA